ncbi:MAG: tryptophan--tRNA ligase [Peptostreptococcus sp.]|uniref:tryptophan--tRNA ligase n=1 Tax=Peptostreptococcus sp. TaxID=1262 RepID=UPI002FCBCAD3
MSEEGKKVIFSGVQPSGQMTLGNYLGALKSWTDLQHDFECYFSMVNMHAITVPQDPEVLRKQTIELLAQFIACGIDPDLNTIFIQSHVPQHAELNWVLSTMTYMGELSRMTQYKDKSKKSEANLNAGLFTYPVLMASDILLYKADVVPVGDDQKQHMELARDLAERFNNRFSDTFVVPEGYYPKGTARVMSLQEPLKKMSKSDSNENGYILLAEDADTTAKKIKKAVTDSVGIVKYNDEQPGLRNLINIYSALTDQTVDQIVAMYEGKGYGAFKKEMAEAVVESLRPMREQYNYLLDNRDYLESIYIKGAQKAEKRAKETLDSVYDQIGFVRRNY